MADTRQKIMQARSNLVLDEPFFGSLVLKLEPVEDRNHKTLWVDGKRIGYNPDYVSRLSNPELQGALCKGVLHVTNGHPWRRSGRDEKTWNEACSYVVNPIVQEAKMVLPKDPEPLVDGQYRGMAAEQVFQARKALNITGDSGQSKDSWQGQRGKSAENRGNSAEKQAGEGEAQGTQEKPKSGDSGADKREKNGSVPPQKGRSQGEGDDPGDGGTDQGSQGRSKAQGEGPGEGEKSQSESGASKSETSEPTSCMDVKDCTDPDKDVLESDWHVAVFQAAQAAKARGDLPNSLELLLQKMREAKIDWKAILRRFMQTFCSSDYSWKRPNRRYLSFGMYLPALQSEQMGPLVIGWDTSGSTLHKQQEFAAEVAEIISEIKPERTYVVYNDARAQRVEEFGPDDQIEFHPQGGGGTNFIPVFDWIEKSMVDPSCLVFFTDLDGRFPAKEPDYPVLWLDCEGRCVAPFGEVVRMDKEG